MDHDDDDDKQFIFFGKDLRRIPCFKKTFTVGIYTGLAVGLGHFLFTSKIKKSTDVAVYSFVGVSFCFWVYCRYNWTKERSLVQKMDKSLHSVMIGEGSQRKFDDV